MNCIITADEYSSGKRIDSVIAEADDNITRSAAQRLIENGDITVNEETVSKNYKVSAGDVIKISVPEPTEIEAKPQDIPLDIFYEDDDLLVVNKPKGMVVHPAAGNPDGTLVNALLFHCKGSLSGINGEIRPGIVHRIDKDTSGLLVVAKNDATHQKLAEQIKEHSFTRCYKAVVHGNIKDDEGTIDAPIGRSPKDRKKMAVTDKNSREAVTHFKVLERFKDYTYIECKLETGRTHQIRVHMAYRGNPVAGDTLYGPKNTPKDLNGQCLHAYKLGFVHPKTDEYMEFEAPLPEYFEKFLKKVRDSR
ncbi:MAG: RluA family pseudouridine synthase [Clostridia bacterium]|nr:RluA family pseudouridine synthase [Clostridia bacterium]MBR6512285.1 RluA family pseudouridine synthase [Clostridia bacterium]